MDKSRLEIKVGLFVLIGLALLAVLLIQFSKGASIFRSTYTLRLHTSNVSGLKPRAGVLLAGVPVGSVSEIQLAPDGRSVVILLKIYTGTKIYHDARFVIEQAGFLGDQYVAIIPAKNELPIWGNNADVPCEQPFDFQEVARSASGFIQRLDETAKKLNASISNIQRTVLAPETLTNFSASIQNMRALSERTLGAVNDINSLIATNGLQINAAISNVVFFSQGLTNLAGSADNLLATNGATFSAAVKNMESASETLTNLMAGLQSGKGLAGTVLQNQQLAANVQAIANNLSITTSNLNQIGLWGILWSHKPPREKSENRTHSPRD